MSRAESRAERKVPVVCVGGGPAGLTAAHELARQGIRTVVLEKDPLYLGGIARTVRYKGYRCDVGGHRFFSKSKRVEDFWTEVLGPDMLVRQRKSRIFYRGELFAYPIRADDVVRKLGLLESALSAASYARAKVLPFREPKNLEEWMVNAFGRRLFSMFFETYTEKVWGMKCSEISADWAAQRVKGLSLGRVIRHAFVPQREKTSREALIKSLIDRFRYPRLGPGMMWEALAARIEEQGALVLKDRTAVAIRRRPDRSGWTVVARRGTGEIEHWHTDHVISSAPIGELFRCLAPPPDPAAARAARALRHRGFLCAALIVKDRGAFDDQWIYIHEPSVKVGRIQNFRSWSPEMTPEPGLTCLGLEYFCFDGDRLWTASDGRLLELAHRELVALGLAEPADLVDGFVIRQPQAYPVYDHEYRAHLETLRQTLDRDYPGIHPVGRNGLHRYNNQDHAMMTAMLTVQNIVGGQRVYDVWAVNQDAEYLEEGEAGRGMRGDERPVPGSV